MEALVKDINEKMANAKEGVATLTRFLDQFKVEC